MVQKTPSYDGTKNPIVTVYDKVIIILKLISFISLIFTQLQK